MKKLVVLLLIITFLVSMLAGCGPKASDAMNEPSQPIEQKVIYALSGEPETLDPTLNIYSRSSKVLQNLFRGLYKLDQNGNTVPAIAEGYEIDATNTIYTFKIRENAKWSDGKPVTAQDFEYAWKRVLDPKTASGASFYLYYIKNGKAYNEEKANPEDVGIKVIDDRTLEVTLENPTPYFLDLLCVTAYFPVRKDIVEGNEFWTKSASTYVCNGPFMLAEIKEKEKYILKKNPYYVDADEVKLETLELLFLESSESELAAYVNDEIHISDNLSPEAEAQFRSSPELFLEPTIGMLYFDINCVKKPFDDIRVRKALSLSINREQIVKNIIQSVDVPAFGFVPFGIPHGVQTDKEYRDVVGNIFTENIDEAKKLLADAGYPDGKGMPKIMITVRTSQETKDIAQALQGMWKQNLGIDSEIQTFESKVYWTELSNGNFDVAYDGWTGDYPDPMTNLDIFETVFNEETNRWSNSEYERLLQENRETADQAKRMENFAKAERILADEMPIIPLYYFNDTYLCKPNVKGVIKNYIGHIILEYAYVE
ncbi:MAG: peptide ABC transporter substrate-binding protein [Firmicutes bacterium]|nr:peptide ABC transporter substrate-binding protein [Bacillota bacterium]